MGVLATRSQDWLITSWASGLEGTKLTRTQMESAKSINDVTKAVQRMACFCFSFKNKMMANPTSGKKVTRMRGGSPLSIEHPLAENNHRHKIGHDHEHTYQDHKSIIAHETGLQAAQLGCRPGDPTRQALRHSIDDAQVDRLCQKS